MEAGVLQQHRRPAPRLAVMQHQVDQRRGLLPRAVEQRQPAILMAIEPQRLAGALQHQAELRGRIDLGAMQQVADFDQILHRQQVLGRAAFHMPAIGEELPLQLARQQAQRPVHPALFLQRHGRGDRRLHHHQGAAMRGLRRQARDDGAAIQRQPGQQRLAKAVIGGRRQKIPVAKPGGDAGTCHLRRLRQILAGAMRQPVMRQVAAAHPRGVRAQRAQVAQPAETMRAGTPQQRAIRRRPADARLIGHAGFKRPGTAEHLQLARRQSRTARRVAGPQILEAAAGRIRHPHRLEAGQPALRTTNQVWHGHPLNAAIAAA